jgi:outer membrane immunogenic protein
MLRKLLGIAGVSSLLIASPLSTASAADMPLKAPMPAPVYSWTGCYIDAGGGYGVWNQDHYLAPTDVAGVTTVTTTDGGRGWLGRFGGGCDYQTSLFNNRIVIGAFADYDPMSLRGSNTPQLVIGGTPETFNSKETNAWYAGARIGYLLTPSMLTYFDGGGTGTHFTNSVEFFTTGAGATGFAFPNYRATGWFLGSGFEYALTDWIPIHGLFLQTEYRFSEYQTSHLSEFSTTTGALTGNVENVKPYVQTITTALVWRFNWTH